MSTKLGAAELLERQADELKTKARKLRAEDKAEQDAKRLIKATGTTGIVYTFPQSAICARGTEFVSSGWDWNTEARYTFDLNDGSRIEAISYMTEVLF